MPLNLLHAIFYLHTEPNRMVRNLENYSGVVKQLPNIDLTSLGNMLSFPRQQHSCDSPVEVALRPLVARLSTTSSSIAGSSKLPVIQTTDSSTFNHCEQNLPGGSL